MAKKQDKKKVEKLKEVKKEINIGIRAYFVKSSIKRHEWDPRTVYASKHIPGMEATYEEWKNLFKKY